MPLIVHCLECGSEVRTYPCLAERKKFCSRRCLGKYVSRTNGFKPGNVVLPNRGTFRVGERTGKDHPRFVPPIVLTCIYCGSAFERKPWQMRRPHVTGAFCSPKCRTGYYSIRLSGPNSPFWVGGPSTYRGRGWKAVRLVVVREQDGKCFDCGRHVGDGLPIHHVRPARYFDNHQDSNHIENLVGLCQSCHMRRETEPVR